MKIRRTKRAIAVVFILLQYFSTVVYADSVSLDVNKDLIMVGDSSTNVNGGYYSVKAEAGDELSFKFYVQNLSDQLTNFNVYPTDTLSSMNGGWNFMPSTYEPILVGSWFKERVTPGELQPGTEIEYTVHAKVPDNILPGQYIGAVALEYYKDDSSSSAKETETESVYKTSVRQIHGIEVVIDVQPQNASHSIISDKVSYEAISEDKDSINLYFRNNGTILESLKGNIRIADSEGVEVFKTSYSTGSIYSGTESYYRVVLDKNTLREGDYVVSYDVAYSDKNVSYVNDCHVPAVTTVGISTEDVYSGSSTSTWLTPTKQTVSRSKVNYIAIFVGLISILIIAICLLKSSTKNK
jgi:hypothetical protein